MGKKRSEKRGIVPFIRPKGETPYPNPGDIYDEVAGSAASDFYLGDGDKPGSYDLPAYGGNE